MTAEELGKQAYQKMMLNEHRDAIQILTGAINKYKNDQRLYTNRCYSYLQIRDFNRAMSDATYVVKNFPSYPKGYFLQGEIHIQMKNYEAAEKCFTAVIHLMKSSEAEEKLFETKMQQLLSKGYEVDVARKAIRLSSTTEEALQNLVCGRITKGGDDGRKWGLQLTDEEERHFAKEFKKLNDGGWTSVRTKHGKEKVKETIDPLTDPANPLKCSSLWVGNVGKDVSETKLKPLFSKYGVSSMKVHPEKKCAFINFNNYTCAGKAMKDLQGATYETQKLILKYPDSKASTSVKQKK